MARGERKAIRDTIGQIILDVVPDWKVYTTRSKDARNDKYYIEVYMANGDQEGQGIATITEARLVVGINKKGIQTDDELDAVGDIIEEALEITNATPALSNDTLQGLVSGLSFAGFEYPPDENSATSTLNLLYAIIFNPRTTE